MVQKEVKPRVAEPEPLIFRCGSALFILRFYHYSINHQREAALVRNEVKPRVAEQEPSISGCGSALFILSFYPYKVIPRGRQHWFGRK